ncbi:hypothetical protein [Paraburkholderia atlantica]|uniref:hypothetical protein n=1 Tax=Paraburkholderia atlantica TaxID=2654982 RepID=UPI003D245DC4
MSAVTLFAWSVPAYFQGSVVDHTWVTTYDSRVTIYPALADVLLAGEHYWYSWGSFRPRPRRDAGQCGWFSGFRRGKSALC